MEIIRFALKPHDSYHNITQWCVAIMWAHTFIWMLSKVSSKLTIMICALGLLLRLGRLPLVSGLNLITKLRTLFIQPHSNHSKIVIFVSCYRENEYSKLVQNVVDPMWSNLIPHINVVLRLNMITLERFHLAHDSDMPVNFNSIYFMLLLSLYWHPKCWKEVSRKTQKNTWGLGPTLFPP